ncbi:MAG: hypothetical protein M1825_004888 [Sarcosagium campestre]|nr:MAG: hypothetical protein M1825_004888 [Sarcosagium campestre]
MASFKKAATNGIDYSAPYRTPSPPPASSIEPLSPLSPVPYHLALSEWPQQTPQRANPAQNGSQHGPVVADISQRPSRPELSSVVIPDAYSPMDTFATIALATSPKYATTDGHLSQDVPIAHPWPENHQSLDDLDDRPTKRARSEARYVDRSNGTEVRPMTSYIARSEKSPFDSALISPAKPASGSVVINANSTESSADDAELLLNVSRVAWVSPKVSEPTRFDDYRFAAPAKDQEIDNSVKIPHAPREAEFSHPFCVNGRNGNEASSEDGLRSEALPSKPHIKSEFDSTGLGITQVKAQPLGDSILSDPKIKPIMQKPPSSNRGWPKGKPRGPRGNGPGVTKARGTATVESARNGATTLPKDRKHGGNRTVASTARAKVFSDLRNTKLSKRPTLQRRASTPALTARSEPESIPKRSGTAKNQQSAEVWRSFSAPPSPRLHQVPLISAATQRLLGRGKPKLGKKGQTATCAGCEMAPTSLQRQVESDNVSWISCDGCKRWFHFSCAGLTEKEVRSVDKYSCPRCQATHGPTTYVRKSGRAHTAIDYAGLNEGVIKTSDESPDHPYIKPIKEDTIRFREEHFARLRPDLVTLDFFESGDGMKEPVVIPASLNTRSRGPSQKNDHLDDVDIDTTETPLKAEAVVAGLEGADELDTVPDDGQDGLDMVIPIDLTVRKVSQLYGPFEKVDVIDVKSQGEAGSWNMQKWADYYETQQKKFIRNVISLEISGSTLGRLVRRPQVVRDLDLVDSVWPAELKAKGDFPKVQLYCLMSVADSYTDFHIDFGGSSVFYHILKGKKTFLFIPPKHKHLKKYEQWCLSPSQNTTFLPNQTNECYRVDLSEGDTMLIPSGWIHAVWTPEDSLVIGGNFLTRLHYGMQIQVAEIEKNTKVPRKFRHPHFQRVMWYTAIRYIEDDPLPDTVAKLLNGGGTFIREVATHLEHDRWGSNSKPGPENFHARYYPRAELDGLPDISRYLLRTASISAGKITDGITADTRLKVTRAIPKSHGEPIELVKTFALWAAWKRGNEQIPHWAYPHAMAEDDRVMPVEKKLSAAALRRHERDAAIEAYRVAPERQSARRQAQAEAEAQAQAEAEAEAEARARAQAQVQGEVQVNEAIAVENASSGLAEEQVFPRDTKTSQPQKLEGPSSNRIPVLKSTDEGDGDDSLAKNLFLGPKRVACDTCRRRRVGCKHKQRVEAPTTTKFARSREAPGGGKIMSPSGSRDSKVDLPNSNSKRSSLEGTASSGPSDISIGHKNRSKACDECRRSKRRCVHDDEGNIDPIKAQEAASKRTSAGIKRSVAESDDGSRPTKFSKTGPNADVSQPTSSKGQGLDLGKSSDGPHIQVIVPKRPPGFGDSKQHAPVPSPDDARSGISVADNTARPENLDESFGLVKSTAPPDTSTNENETKTEAVASAKDVPTLNGDRHKATSSPVHQTLMTDEPLSISSGLRPLSPPISPKAEAEPISTSIEASTVVESSPQRDHRFRRSSRVTRPIQELTPNGASSISSPNKSGRVKIDVGRTPVSLQNGESTSPEFYQPSQVATANTPASPQNGKKRSSIEVRIDGNPSSLESRKQRGHSRDQSLSAADDASWRVAKELEFGLRKREKRQL